MDSRRAVARNPGSQHAVLAGTTSFNPNSAGLWDNQPEFAELPLPIEGEAAHYNHYADDDHWEQPDNLFRLMTPAQQQRRDRQFSRLGVRRVRPLSDGFFG